MFMAAQGDDFGKGLALHPDAPIGSDMVAGNGTDIAAIWQLFIQPHFCQSATKVQRINSCARWDTVKFLVQGMPYLNEYAYIWIQNSF